LSSVVFLSMIPPPPGSSLFPYTTLFRSICSHRRGVARGHFRCARHHEPNPDRGECSPRCARPPPAIRLQQQPVHPAALKPDSRRSEEHTSELQSRGHLVCRPPLEQKKIK